MREITRDDVIGRSIVRAVVKKWREDDGFGYSEALIQLDNGVRFVVNSVGVDGPEPLMSHGTSPADGELIDALDVEGQVITGIAISDYLPTFGVMTDRGLIIHGQDFGAPFQRFGPVVSNLGEVYSVEDLRDFWSRAAFIDS